GARWGLTGDTPVPVEGLIIAPGGRPDGDDRPAARGSLSRGQEAAPTEGEKPQFKEPERPSESPPLKPQVTPLLPEQRKDGGRPIEEQTGEAVKELSRVSGTARKQLEEALRREGRGPRGPGGDGPGGGNIDNKKRPERQLRWTLIFNTRDGHDYLR